MYIETENIYEYMYIYTDTYLHLSKICSPNTYNEDWKWKIRCLHQSIYSFLEISYYPILQKIFVLF